MSETKRTSKDTQFRKKYLDIFTKEVLIELHHNKKMTVADIGMEFKCSTHTVKRYMNLYGVEHNHYRILKPGYRYFMLTIVKRLGQQKDGRWLWLCKCDCGNVKEIHFKRASSGQGSARSCGCLFNPKGEKNCKWKGCGEISGKQFGHIKSRARIDKIEIDITIEYIWDLWEKQKHFCAISGLPLDMQKTASLDRIDSDKGYVVGNVQWTHKIVNCMKNVRSTEELTYYCKAIVEHQEGPSYAVDSDPNSQRFEPFTWAS